MRKLFLKPLALGLLLAACTAARAQKPIGTVSTADASVGGVLETSGATATIVNNGTITAHEHTATVTLARGGSVQVCATSVVHLSQSIATAASPLLVALDHGAVELSFLANSSDAILTPDMRVQPSAPGPLDLRLRVVSNGDTCIENRGSNAPALMISDTFGESSYIVHSQQHVLFEHGSLKQVVDSESSPCGCPPPAPVISVADSGGSGTNAAKPGSVVDAHPFPAAVSQGLAPAPPQPEQPVRQVHTEPGMTLAYNGTTEPAAQNAEAGTGITAIPSSTPAIEATTATPAATPSTPASAPAIAQAPPPPPPPTGDLVHAIVRFYRWVFRRKS